MSNQLQSHHFDKATDFLEFLESRCRRKFDWIYRGQGDATWKLIPSILRGTSCTIAHISELAEHELTLIEKFISRANRTGVAIPSSVVPHQKYNYKTTTIDGSVDPNLAVYLEEDLANGASRGGFISLNAIIARHSGIDSRLYDFTYNPLVAAYFAANYKVESGQNQPEKIVVWGVYKRVLEDIRIRIIEYPYDRYIFIRNQESLCLYDEFLMSASCNKGAWVTLEDRFEKLSNEEVFKVTLDYTQCCKVIELLERSGISKDLLMPDLKNIADAVMKRFK